MATQKDAPQFRILADSIRQQIETDQLRPGQRLPSIRTLSATYGLGRQIVLSAFQLLTDEGLLRSGVGSGTIVNPDLHARTQCHVALVLLQENLNNETYRHLDDILRAAMKGTRHTLQVHENVTQQSLADISADCVLLSGYVSNVAVKSLEERNQRRIIIGNYLPTFWKNHIRFLSKPQIRRLLMTDPTRRKTVGVMADSAAYVTTRELLEAVEEFVLESGLPWSPKYVLAVNDGHGHDELRAVWKDPRDIPQRIVTDTYLAAELIAYLRELKIPERQYPDLLLHAGSAPIPDLPPSVKIHRTKGNPMDFGRQLLQIIIRYVIGNLKEGFQATYEPLSNVLNIQATGE